MGSALIVSVVDEEEFIGGPVVEHHGELRRLRELYSREEWWPIRNAPEAWAKRHPDAHFPLAVPVLDAWGPPSERSLLTSGTRPEDRWAAHTQAVSQSLQAFINARLVHLGGALRTGRWILDHVRVAVSAIAGSAAEDDGDVIDSELDEQLRALEADLRHLYRRASDLASAAGELGTPEASRVASVRDTLGALVDNASPE